MGINIAVGLLASVVLLAKGNEAAANGILFCVLGLAGGVTAVSCSSDATDAEDAAYIIESFTHA